MSKLEERLKKEDAIGFILEKDEREKFLRWAKANDLKWMNGEEIKETEKETSPQETHKRRKRSE